MLYIKNANNSHLTTYRQYIQRVRILLRDEVKPLKIQKSATNYTLDIQFHLSKHYFLFLFLNPLIRYVIL